MDVGEFAHLLGDPRAHVLTAEAASRPPWVPWPPAKPVEPPPSQPGRGRRPQTAGPLGRRPMSAARAALHRPTAAPEAAERGPEADDGIREDDGLDATFALPSSRAFVAAELATPLERRIAEERLQRSAPWLRGQASRAPRWGAGKFY